MTGRRYELRVAGRLSDRAQGAFPGMRVATVRSQTSICAECDDGTDLHELLRRCSGMGLGLISVRRLPLIPPVHAEDVRGPHHVAPMAGTAADGTDVRACALDSSASGGAAELRQEQPSVVGEDGGGA